MKISIKKENSEVLFSPDSGSISLGQVQSEWFQPSFWNEGNRVVGQSQGRKTTWFIKPENTDTDKTWVLRHYYRGGMIARLTEDKFVYTGIFNTRSFKEVALLSQMYDLGLPVPKPIAGRIIRKFIFYQADLLMEKIDAVDLVAFLSENTLSEQLWSNIGETIAKFHVCGIDHKDLNAHNIMIDKNNKIWLIDFDRCKKKALAESWMQNNLDRLKRSFDKEKRLNSHFYFLNKNWNALMSGYAQIRNRH